MRRVAARLPRVRRVRRRRTRARPGPCGGVRPGPL